MENTVCQFCHKQCNEPELLQCNHPICSKCAQTLFSFALLRTPCDRFQLKTEHKQEEGKQEIDFDKKTANICCPKCNEKTILMSSQGDIKLSNNQQLSVVNDGLGENHQQQQHILDEMLQWMFQFLNAKVLFKKIRFTCLRVDKIVCTSLLSLHCQRLRINVLKFAREVLPKETQLQELNLMLSNIDDNEVNEIAKVFPLILQLQTLNLSWNKIGNTGASAIANSITNLTQLQRLNLDDNQIGFTGATAIANSLSNLTQLQELYLYDNQIGDTGTIAIANSISNLTQSQVLNISRNRIGDTGATAIANSITKLTQLQQLYLYNNQIGDTGATALANSISSLIRLEKLSLCDNNISEPVKQQLKQQFDYKLLLYDSYH